MSRRIALRLTLILVALLATAAPASAGGWAVVHLDAAPENIAVGVPVEIGLTVLQHDRTPTNADGVTLHAQHRESAETYRATAVQEGAVGHYVVEAVFPRAGEWKWSIIPAPFAGTSFETLTVLDAPSGDSPDAPAGETAARSVQIAAGSCAARGETRYTLDNQGSSDDSATTGHDANSAGTVGSPDGLPVAISATTLDVTIAELLTSPYAVAVEGGAATIACGDIGGRMWDGMLVVGLQAVGETSQAGIATLREVGDRTTITVYLIPTSPGGDPAPASVDAGDAVAVQIADVGFSPSQVSIAAGTTVTWTNAGAITHTITGGDLAFDDSGPLAPGDTFTQTFDEPGTYAYRCGPHPNMVGAITVT